MNNIFDGYSRLHIDIGANEGKTCLDIARYYPQTFVVGFEPIPKLVRHMKGVSNHLKNFLVIESAVSNYNGISKFNISPESQYGDYSCSSLLEFSDKSKTDWPGRTDFQVIGSTDVQVMRLDKFITDYNIKQIDYLKIDTQGHDLKVLEGCGEFLSIIKEGNMEAGAKDNILYNGQNTEAESIQFLESNGFEIVLIEPNDVFRNEVNIIFRNRFPKTANYKKICEIK